MRKNNYGMRIVRMADNGASSSGGSGNAASAATEEGQPQRSSDAPPASWDEIFQHERFKQLLDRAKRAEGELAKVTKTQADAEEAKLREQQRFEELYKNSERRAADLELKLAEAAERFDNERKRQAVEAAARAHEPKFRADALGDLPLFVDLATLTIGEDGKISGAEAVIKALAKERPYMLDTQRTDPGSPAGKKPAGAAHSVASGKPLTL